MPTLNQIKLLLATVVLLFVAAATYLWIVVMKQQAALEEGSRYNVAWLTSQATTEYARLEQRISALSLPDSGTDPDEVELRFAIVINRLKLLQSGDVAEFVKIDPEHQETVQDLERVLHKARPLIARIEQPGTAGTLLALLAPLDAKLARLAAAANQFSGDRAGDDQRRLIHLHYQFSALAGGLIVGGLLLMGLLFWHNNLLSQSHRETKLLADEIRAKNQRFDAALNNMSQGLCMVDAEHRLIVCNNQYQQLFGLNSSLVVPGQPMGELHRTMAMSGRRSFGFGEMNTGQHPRTKIRKAATFAEDLPDGRTIAVSQQPMADGGWVATYEDISERRHAEARIMHMAHHDALTGLPNRVLLRKHMVEAFAKGSATVVYLDLDGFKKVNDTLGHPVGDTLLKHVADRLRSCVRDTDIVARLGGDEFALLRQEDGNELNNELLALRLLEVIRAPYDLGGQHVVISTSIGIALAPRDGTDPDQILKNADVALYRAKAHGRNTFRFFEPSMDAELQCRRAMELDLRNALGSNQFELWYQPLVNLKTEQIACFEALLRWNHPDRGMVSPAEFIPVAEDVGLIVPIGEWLLRQACNQAAGWPEFIKLSVNLSPLQLKDGNLLQAVILALAGSGLAPARLELEITERIFLEENEATLSILHELRSLGIQIAMDDFGTGYSSLSYLRSFPFDKIKLDQSFVRDIAQRPDCKAIVQSIAMLGQNLGMITTAEGIETEEQLSLVRDAGFIEGQGYFFSRPQPIGQFDLPRPMEIIKAA